MSQAAPVLYHRPNEWPLLWQWWAEVYIAGFRDEARAKRYGRRNRWCE